MLKLRAIKKVIRDKIDEWLDTIEDDDLVEAIKSTAFVCGGAIASLLLGEEVNDFDVYFSSTEVAMKVVNYYLVDIDTKYSIHQEDEGVALNIDTYNYINCYNYTHEYYMPKSITKNAITLNNDVQIVFKFVDSPENITKNFDFVHTMCFYWYDEDLLELPDKALSSILTKELYYTGSTYPVSAMFRTRKFIERGWFISAGQMLKILLDVQNFDLTDPLTLKDQLLGVDATYFTELLEVLDTDTIANTFSMSWLFDLIDRVF